MREPHISGVDEEGGGVPYSLAETFRFKDVLERRVVNATGSEFYNPDFRRRYAALLLAERGQ